MGAVSLFTDEAKKVKSQNWYEAKLRQGMGKLRSLGQKWPTVFFFFNEVSLECSPSQLYSLAWGSFCSITAVD